MSLRILFADDSMTAQNMGKKILTDAGYEVVAVSNGAAAVKKIAEQKPDIIILDVYMPGYSGLEVCEKVRASIETLKTPVLLTVGKMEPYKPEDASRVRADGVIIKPFEASDLLAIVKKLEERIVPKAPPIAEQTILLERPPDFSQFEHESFQVTPEHHAEERNTAQPMIAMSDEMASSAAFGDLLGMDLDDAPVAATPPPPHPPIPSAPVQIDAPMSSEFEAQSPATESRFEATPPPPPPPVVREMEAPLSSLEEDEDDVPEERFRSAAPPPFPGAAVVEPAVAEPPAVMEAAVAGPAVVEESVVEPSVSDPPVSGPSVVGPSVSEPPVIEPSVIEPPALNMHASAPVRVEEPAAPVEEAPEPVLITHEPTPEVRRLEVLPDPEFEEPVTAASIEVPHATEPALEPTRRPPIEIFNGGTDPALVSNEAAINSFPTKFGVENPEDIPVGIAADVPELQATEVMPAFEAAPEPPMESAPVKEPPAVAAVSTVAEDDFEARVARAMSVYEQSMEAESAVEMEPEPVEIRAAIPPPVPMMEPPAAAFVESEPAREPVIHAIPFEPVTVSRSHEPAPSPVVVTMPSVAVHEPAHFAAPEPPYATPVEPEPPAVMPAPMSEVAHRVAVHIDEEIPAVTHAASAAASADNHMVAAVVQRVMERLKPELIEEIVRELRDKR